MPLLSVKLAGGADVTVVWASAAPADRTLVESSAARRQAADRFADIMIPGERPSPNVRLGGTVWYTVRLRLRVTKQRTQRVGKLLIGNLRPGPACISRRCQMRSDHDVASG